MKMACPNCGGTDNYHDDNIKLIRLDSKIMAIDVYCHLCGKWFPVVGMVI